jgi:hypothetical protein
MSDSKTQVEALIAKAAASDKPDDAMKLSQAALNAAQAMCVLKGAAAA